MRILHSTIIGEGADIIILHGFLGMGDNWKSHGKKFAQAGYRVHLLDQRNHGRSFWDDEFTYHHLTEDLLLYMDHHQIGNAILIGHSMGGKAAMHFVSAYPERCLQLIVVDIAPRYYPPHHQHIIEALQSLTAEDLFSRSAADKALSKHIDEVGLRQFLLKNLYWQSPGTLAFRCNLNVLSKSMDIGSEPLIGTEQYTGSSLFLKGELSDYITETDKKAIHTYFSAAQIKTISSAGHWLHAENPEGFLNTVLPFLERR